MSLLSSSMLQIRQSQSNSAAAHKLARLVYTMLTRGTEYVDKGQEYYEERYRQRVVHNLNKKAAAMGFFLMPAPEKAS